MSKKPGVGNREVYRNGDKLLKLVHDFGYFNSIRELTTVVYIGTILDRLFDYESDRFDMPALDGIDCTDVYWDLFDLSKEMAITRRSPIQLTPKAQRFCSNIKDIDFRSFRERLSKMDRKEWPVISAYLYCMNHYKGDLEKVKKALNTGYYIDEEKFERIHKFIAELT